MKKLSLLLTLLLCFARGISAQPSGEYETKIIPLKNEKWWGIYLVDSPQQPLITPFSCDMEQDAGRIYRQYAPVMVSSEGRYVWSAEPFAVEFDGSGFTINSHEKIEVQKGGKSLREAYLICRHKNRAPSGIAPQSDLFTLPLYEAEDSAERIQGQNEIVEYARKLKHEGFPAGMIVIGYGWKNVNSEYGFDKTLYPDVKAMTDELHSLGFKVMLTITPSLPATGRGYLKAKSEGRLLTDRAGDPVITTSYNSTACALYDMGNAVNYGIAAAALDNIRNTCGFDAFRFDSRMADYNNMGADRYGLYMDNWMKLGKDLTGCQYFGGRIQPLAQYAADIYPGTQDNGADFVKKSVNCVTVAGLMGYIYSCIAPDENIANKSEDEKYAGLMLRMFMPSANVGYAPWMFSAERYESIKKMLNFRASIGDYVKAQLEDSAKTAEPIVRHMEYQFPHSGFADCNDQFMLGSKYLVAPVPCGVQKRLVRLPKGIWIDTDGHRIKGPVVTEASDENGIIIFERK